MITQDEYNEIEQRMADKEIMIDILSKQLSDITIERNNYRIWNEVNEKWIDELETMLICDGKWNNTTTNNSKVMRFFAPITRRLRALFGSR